MAVVIETALHLVFDELLKVVAAQTIQTTRFKNRLQRIQSTLKSIQPVFYESWRLSKVLDRPQKETIVFVVYMKRGKKLVIESSRITSRNMYQKSLHSIRLIRLNSELVRFFQTELQVKTVSSMRGLIGVNDVEDQGDELLSDFTAHVSAEGMYASENLLEFSSRNLTNLVPVRKDAGKLEGYCNEHYATQPGLLRELTIDLSGQQLINSRILSISSDELITSNWCDLKALGAEELTLNITSETYSLPEILKAMGQLKVLNITSCSDYPSKLHNLSLIGCLSNLRKIRFEHVSVSSIQPIFALRNLKELSFVMCEIGDALMSCATESPYMLSNLTTLEIDMCYDLKELPSALCSLAHLQKLSITNCHELYALPEGLGGLSNLEILGLRCCTKLQELPESIGSLYNLRSIDISDCLSICLLPEEIGDLCGLRVLKINGCGGLQELPTSMSELLQLEEVICDEETSYLWMDFESDLHNLKINAVEEDRLESFMKIVQ